MPKPSKKKNMDTRKFGRGICGRPATVVLAALDDPADVPDTIVPGPEALPPPATSSSIYFPSYVVIVESCVAP